MADPSTLAAFIESLGLSRVACVGDVMLDRFVYGRVERTSPEAPVPILRTDHDVYMLGGRRQRGAQSRLARRRRRLCSR